MIYFFMFRLIFCSAWLGTILAVGIAFIALSKKEQKRTNLFRLQSFCVFLTIIYNASEVGNVLYRLKTLTFRSNQTLNYTAYTHWTSFGHCAEHLIPILADSALLFRISSFFPFPIYSKKARFFILSPFWFLIICRFILAILVIPFILVQWFSGIEINPMDSIPIMMNLYGQTLLMMQSFFWNYQWDHFFAWQLQRSYYSKLIKLLNVELQ